MLAYNSCMTAGKSPSGRCTMDRFGSSEGSEVMGTCESGSSRICRRGVQRELAVGLSGPTARETSAAAVTHLADFGTGGA